MVADGNQILLGEWMYDEKEEPELTRQDAWRKAEPTRELGRQGDDLVVSRELLKSGHCHIRGKTGAGKSSRIILPLAEQLMCPYVLEWESLDGMPHQATERDAILIIDLGGDRGLFNAVKHFAEKHERRFRFLSLEERRSQKFDVFQSIRDSEDRIIRLCSLFQEAFSLDHGLAYGGSWYSQRNLLLLLTVCERLVANKRSGQEITLRAVDRYLEEHAKTIRDSEQIRGLFRFLLEYGQLQPGPHDTDVINLKESIENRDVVYAFLPTIAEATTARQLAGLMLYCAANAAMAIHEQADEEYLSGRPHPHTHIFVDEFQQIVGPSFEALLTGIRKFSCSLYMANQSTESLKTRDLDLASTVRDNCSVKLYQTVTGEEDIRQLLTFSRETTRRLTSRKQNESIRIHGRSALGGTTESEQITTQLSRAEILDISATTGACLAIIDDGVGHREPIPLMTSHRLSKSEYLKFRATPLPLTAKSPSRQNHYGRLLASMPAWRANHLEVKKSEVHQERLSRFENLLQQLIAEERPGPDENDLRTDIPTAPQ